eukprot:10578896-Heterocapsa_arctica.AAC.1
MGPDAGGFQGTASQWRTWPGMLLDPARGPWQARAWTRWTIQSPSPSAASQARPGAHRAEARPARRPGHHRCNGGAIAQAWQ